MKKYTIYFITFMLTITLFSCNNNSENKSDTTISNKIIETDDLYHKNESTIIDSIKTEKYTFIDSRDEHIYNTVKIGNQIWFAENLAYYTKYGCWAYDNDKNNVEKTGYLYNWKTAKKVCPDGWHLPSDADWIKLLEFLGDKETKTLKLKATNIWKRPHPKNNNSTSFSAIPSGYRKLDGTFDEINTTCNFWTTTIDKTNVWVYNINSSQYAKILKVSQSKKHAYSIRCIKN